MPLSEARKRGLLPLPLVPAPTVFLCAPQGAGKNVHAPAIAAMFGCTSIVDEWICGDEVPEGALILTFETPETRAA